MAPLPQTSSLPLSTFNDSDEEDSLADTPGGVTLFTMETNSNNRDFGDQALLPTGETAEHVPGTRKRSDSSASDRSDDSEKTVVPSSMIGNCGVVSTISDSAVALLSTNMPTSEETSRAESDPDRTVLPNRINGNGGTRSGYTVEAYDAIPKYHLPTEIEYPVHEDQNGYVDDIGHFRTLSGEHRIEYPVQEGQSGYLDHSRSSSRASSFEAGLRSLSLSNGTRDANDNLKYPSPLAANRGHQRNISRNSSYPSVPSPLGPKTFTTDLMSDVSGLVPSASSTTTSRPRGARPVSQPELKSSNEPTRTDSMSYSSPQKMLNTVAPSTHHKRQYTDPFIDREGTNGLSPVLDHIHSPRTSTPHLLSPGIGSSPTEPTDTFTFPDPGPYYAQNAPAPTPSQRLATAALTDEQKCALRQTWIASGTREIVALGRARAVANAQYQATRTLADLQVLQEATAALAEATNLEKRVEQRRNLLMPAGVQAMRTTAESLPQDGFGGSEVGGGRGEGRLLGGEMAVMERICGEVVRSAEERRRRRGGV